MVGKFGANHLVMIFPETVTKNYANVNRDQIYKLACIGHGFTENRDQKYTNVILGHG